MDLRSSRVPRSVPGIDIKTLPLSPLEGFVLSQVDGRASAHDIAVLTSLSDDVCADLLDRLHALNAIEWDDIELAPDRRAQIDELWANLDRRNHYQLLGVARTAPRNEIHKEYFLRSKAFHPDRAFGKKLGGYKKKMEVIFTRLTDADHVLCDPARRAEYDRHLDAIGDDRDGGGSARAPRIDATPTGPHRVIQVSRSGPVPVVRDEDGPPSPSPDGPTPSPASDQRRRASVERLRRWLGGKK